MRTLLHVVCAWCDQWQASEYVPYSGCDEMTSHTICDACHLAQYGTEAEAHEETVR